jgi:GH25 family lysozyme M1 (1,4-beta-N-acetylmuramidase)
MRAPSASTHRITPAMFEMLESRLFLSRVEGIDVSYWQGAINWNKAYEMKKEFAFVRSSRTNLTLDENFVTNMTNAKAAGVLVGPYHRALPMGEAEGGTYTDPITDARRFFNAAGAYMTHGHLRPVLDIEDGHSLGKTELSKWVNAFTAEINRLSGQQPIIYASTNYSTNFLDASVSSQHDLWIARWNGGNANNVNPQIDQPETPGGYPNPYGSWNKPIGSTTPSHSSWSFWQYTSNGDGPAHGMSSARLDLDVFNGDMETLKRGFLIGHQWNYNGGNPFAVGSTPVTIQAEHYDHGGQGVAYNDNTITNGGPSFRSNEGVDLKLISGSNYRVNNTFAGEWIEYSINVAAAGNYNLELRVSSKGSNGRFHVQLRNPATDGLVSNLTGPWTMPNTGSNDTWTTISKQVSLPAGRHVLRVAFDQNSSYGSVGNIDWLRFSRVGSTPVGSTIITNTATYVRGGAHANTNFGNASDLIVKRASSADNTRETYLLFDLTSVSAINSAKLRVFGRLSDTANASLRTDIFSAANTSWSEPGLTWNNRPTAGTTVRGSFTVAGTAANWYEVDLTSFLKSEFAAGRKKVTLVLKNAASSSAQTVFASDETANGPRLVLT